VYTRMCVSGRVVVLSLEVLEQSCNFAWQHAGAELAICTARYIYIITRCGRNNIGGF